MNQYQNRSSEEQKTFLSKIKDNYSAKFGNLSITSSIQKASSYVDKDGSSETDTLIHNAFVKYFDQRGQAYPEWLGIPQANKSTYQSYGQRSGQTNGYQSQSQSVSSQQYRPVYTNYNTPSEPQQPQQADGRPQVSPMQSQADAPVYKPRSSSRLQDMYNKSRMQHTPGGGYTTVNQTPGRSNSSTSGSRLRERILNSTSMTGMSNHLNGDGNRPARR